MMRLQRASVIVTVVLLTCAATAYAECAWVLWLSDAHRRVRGGRRSLYVRQLRRHRGAHPGAGGRARSKAT
jgi:hypothetical protein